jgi:hypothetical protein
VPAAGHRSGPERFPATIDEIAEEKDEANDRFAL